MVVQQDYAGLEWVSEEIEQTLSQARQSLEKIQQGSDDRAVIDARTALNQVHGVLRMLQMKGISFLGDEMNGLFALLADGELPNSDTALEVLMRATLQLPNYLRQISIDQTDRPMLLYPLINGLRQAQGKDPLPEAQFFYPELNNTVAPLESDRIQRLNQSGLQPLLKKIRQRYQLAFVSYLRGQKIDQQVVILKKLFSKLQDICWESPVSVLWEACIALTEGIENGSLEQSTHIANIFRGIDGQIRAFIQKGAQFVNTTPDYDLLRMILFYVALAEGNRGFIGVLKERYQLRQLVDEIKKSDSGRVVSEDARHAVVEELYSELAVIKEALDLHLHSANPDPAVLKNRCSGLRQIADTLRILGMSEFSDRLSEQQTLIQRVVENGEESGQRLMEVAKTLLELETALHLYARGQRPGGDNNQDILNDVYQTIIHESYRDLQQAKSALVEYAGYDDTAVPERVPYLLQNVYSGLAMTPMTRVAQLVRLAQEYFQGAWLDGAVQPEPEELEKFTDALACIEYHLEQTASSGKSVPDTVLDLADESLNELSANLTTAEVVQSHEESRNLELLEVFVAEANEMQKQLTRAFTAWQYALQDDENLKELCRAFHTLKGSGRMVGASVIGELTRSIENMLRRLTEGEIKNSPELRALVSRTIQMMPGLVNDFTKNNQALHHDVLACMEQADALSEGRSLVVGDDPFDGDSLGDFDSTDFALYKVDEAVETPAVEVEPPPTESRETNYDPQLAETSISTLDVPVAAIQQHIGHASQTGTPLFLDRQLLQLLHTLKNAALGSDNRSVGEIVVAIDACLSATGVHEAKIDPRFIRKIEEGLGLIRMTGQTDRAFDLAARAEQYIHELELLQDQLVREKESTLSTGDPLDTFANTDLLTENFDLLLNADAYLSVWRNALHKNELKLFQKELVALAALAKSQSVLPLVELCQLIGTVLDYLDQHETFLPGRLAAPLSNSFGTVVDIINQVTAQQAPLLPESVLSELQSALEGMKSSRIQATAEEGASVVQEGALATTGLSHEQRERTTEQRRVEKESGEAVVDSSDLSEEQSADNSLLQLFIDESLDLLENFQKSFSRWIRDRTDSTALTDIQHTLHTLKGSARMADQHELGDLSHAIEGVYSVIADNSVQSRIPVTLVRSAHEGINQMLTALKNNQPLADVQGLIEQLKTWVANESGASSEPGDQSTGTEVGGADKGIVDKLPDTIRSIKPVASHAVNKLPVKGHEIIRVPIHLLEQLISLSSETLINHGPIEEKVQSMQRTLEEVESTVERLREQLHRLELEAQTRMVSSYSTVASEGVGSSLQDTDQYMELHQLLRSLEESASDLKLLKESFQTQGSDVEMLLQQQSHTLVTLQKVLMRAQVVSLDRLVPRLHKITRQLSSELKKPVILNIVNAENEMDRTIMERILPPLEHLLRNAIDHGIESSVSERLALGKPATGELDLKISHNSTDMVIELSDDGQGIDLNAVREKALEKNIIQPEESLTDQDIANLVLKPGLSTAESVTQISGRGVGLDVVNTEVRSMGGSIQINTRHNRGTSFVLQLPFTLSVNRALLVRSSSHLYALPMQLIDSVTTAEPASLRESYRSNSPITLNGKKYQVAFLAALLNRGDSDMEQDLAPVVIISRNDVRLALHVDEVIGGREIFTKSLGPKFSGVTGVNGATVLGDGRVAVIIDPVALHLKQDRGGQTLEPLDQSSTGASVSDRVLVVDDSVTMRRATTQILQRQGFEVDSAKDGAQALVQLAENRYQVVLLDIEMPKMDGFEVASSIRRDHSLGAELPIVMITSRTGEEHREKARSLGINHYLGKPFEESELMSAIADVTQKKTDVSDQLHTSMG